MDLFNLDSASLAAWLPGLDKLAQATPEPHQPVQSTASSRSSFRRPTKDQARLSTSARLTGDDGEGMPKKNGRKVARKTKDKATPASTSTRAALSSSHKLTTSVTPTSFGRTAPLGSSYPQSIVQDDLSSTPLYSQKNRPVAPQPLHPINVQQREEDHFSRSPSAGSSARSFVREARDEYIEDDFYPASNGNGQRRSASAGSSEFSSSELYSDDDESSFSYSGDEADFSGDEDDEERPFPSPQRAKQERYFRAPEVESSSSGDSGSASSPPQAEGKGKTKLISSFVDPSLLPPHFHNHHYTPTLPAEPVLSPTHVSTAPSSKISQLNKLPSPLPAAPHSSSSPAAKGLETYYHPPASSLESPSALPRGRNPHPRLLWRSAIDVEALKILDAHHARVVGGPLPRLSSSGVEAERDHAGAREGGERGRSRSQKRWMAGRIGGRREWSIEGRRWSREVEKCGL
ncbi:hypothetical protein JCM10213_005073 [Rhodosporidiobolus nylandii]